MGNVLIYLLVFIEAFCIEEKYINYYQNYLLIISHI